MNIHWRLALFSRLPAWLIVFGMVMVSLPISFPQLGRLVAACGLGLFLLHPDRRWGYLAVCPLLIVPLLATMMPWPWSISPLGTIRLTATIFIWLCITIAASAASAWSSRIMAARQRAHMPPAPPAASLPPARL